MTTCARRTRSGECSAPAQPGTRICAPCEQALGLSWAKAKEQQDARPHTVQHAQPVRLLGTPEPREPKRRAGATPEALVLREVVKALETVQGLHIMRNSVGMVTTQHGRLPYGLGVGSSDLVGILAPSGRWVAIEVKSEDGDLTDAQRAWLHRMRERGAIAGVARSGAEALAIIEMQR